MIRKTCPSLSKRMVLSLIDPEVLSANDKLVNLIKAHNQIASSDGRSSIVNSDDERPLANSDESSYLEFPYKQSEIMNSMLTVTIGCVMLMASNIEEEISEKHLTWAERYLRCIKNEDGVHPPNVRGILNQIGLLRAKTFYNC